MAKMIQKTIFIPETTLERLKVLAEKLGFIYMTSEKPNLSETIRHCVDRVLDEEIPQDPNLCIY